MSSYADCPSNAGYVPVSFVAYYDRSTQTYTYREETIRGTGRLPTDRPLWDFLAAAELLSARDAEEARLLCEAPEAAAVFREYVVRGKGRHRFGFVCMPDNRTVAVTITAVGRDSFMWESMPCDDLTGLMTRNAFCSAMEEQLRAQESAAYVVLYFDIIKFKAINDIYGYDEGDRLLCHIASCLQSNERIPAACRESGDHFACLMDVTGRDADAAIRELLYEVETFDLPFEITCNAGVYAVPRSDESGVSMLDKAMLAQATVKGSYTRKVHYFTDVLRDEMLSEQEIAGCMNAAMEQHQFLVYYQPQYNHSTGMIIGAEALVRWMHPERGLISPGIFIPVFEKNGFITKLDLYMFEEACRFLRRSLDENFSIVPLSINFSKHDIYLPGFAERLESIRTRYGVPAKFLRIEITESAMMGNARAVNDIFKTLHQCGYVIELDDFGSGYSSLNVLKDLDIDIIKLDLLFLDNRGLNDRGGTIVSSVVNMAKWLRLPVIAEGVETVEQADFLRSIGCDYIQGYLYSRPLPEADYERLISSGHVGAVVPQMSVIDTMNVTNFWDPSSQETLIFSNFVGGAAIFYYDRDTGHIEVLRVNKKYLQELGMNLSEREIISSELMNTMDDENRAHYIRTLERAIETVDEQECETWRTVRSDCCGEDHICIRSTLRMIGQSDNRYLFYAMIHNITAEKNIFSSMEDAERRFKMASEQVNIYFWEYTIATREMRPCFRCMRDLGLPPLLRNYPDSAIERGIFPPEVADMYRDWHVQVANGVKELEAIIPLTENRVPFRVRYTTEFDENGHPVKAYGSAALVVN